MKLNALFATLLLATTTCASATVLTFDSVAVSGCSDGAAYMAGFGITVTGAASARICNSAPVGGAQAYSGSNLLLLDNPPPSNSTYTYFFTFASPVDNVSFVRTQINPDSTGPAWTATALSASSSVLASTGEGTTFAPAAQIFSFNASGIASIRFDTNNTSARTYNTPPIDDLSFSSVPEPGTLPLTAMAILGTVLWRRKQSSTRHPRH